MKRLTTAVFAAVLACAAFAETYYANGGGTKSYYAYDWYNKDNWKVKDANDNLVDASSAPQRGDTVIFDKAISYMSLFPDSSVAPGLQKVQFNVPNIIHQGYVSILAGGEGIVMNCTGSMGWWAGIHIAGTGEAPIVVPAGATLNNQKGVRTESKTADVTLVKQGAGHFNTAYEGGNIYNPLRTKLQGGTITMRASEISTGHEFVFDSNDPDLLLRFNYAKSQYRDWTIQNGALLESAEVDNTTHGITSDGSNNHLYYLRLTGTPKLAEQRFTGQLYSTAGLAFLPGAKTNGNDFVFTFAKAVSSAGGGISVTNGTVRLAEGASFTALQRLDVGSTGTFKVESGCGANFVCGNLDIASGGKLNLAAGVTLRFSTGKAGGSTLTDGVYTSATANWIDGDGEVVVGAPMLDPIVLTVASGETYLPEALDAYNASTGESVTFASLNGGADRLRTLVKRGAGRLNLTNAMASYEGTISIEGGILFSNAKNALGKTPNDAHPIYVRANAQYRCQAKSDTYNSGRIFHVQGHGPDSNNPGALCLLNGTGGNSGVGKVYGLAGMAGKAVVLDGETTLYSSSSGSWIAYPSITLGGHNLIFRGNSPDTPQLVGTFYGDGDIYVTNTAFRLQGLKFEQTAANHVVHVGNSGQFRFVSDQGGGTISGSSLNKWSVEFASNANALYGSWGFGWRNQTANIFTIPVTVNSVLTLRCQGDRKYAHVFFDQPLTGPGGIKTTAKIDNQKWQTGWLHLRNAANSFAGGLQFDRGVIWDYVNGAIPADGGAVKLARANSTDTSVCVYDGVAFLKPHEKYTLPELQVSGSYPARVQFGEGAWKKVLKEGASTLEYYSEVGAPLVEVKAGTLKLPRGAAPGLWEGIAAQSSAANAQNAFNGAATPTNTIVRGPHMANMREKDNTASWTQKSLVTYTGYVWNRTGADASWTFASSLKDHVAVLIDGAPVLTTSATGTLVKATVTLTPGPHRFTWRSWNGADDITGPHKPTGWAANFGFVYDAQGRDDTSNTNNFVLATDTGDGALFTRYTNTTERLPAFGTMAFDQGAVLDLNGNAYAVNEITGWPTVTNSCTDATSAAALTVTNSFTIDGATLAAGRQLVSHVPVTFTAGATVTLTNSALVARNGQKKFTVLTAPSLTWNRSKLKQDGKDWIVLHDPETNTLTLEYCAGTLLILR